MSRSIFLAEVNGTLTFVTALVQCMYAVSSAWIGRDPQHVSLSAVGLKNETVTDPPVTTVFFNENPPLVDETPRRKIRSLPDGTHEVLYECEFCCKMCVTQAQLTCESVWVSKYTVYYIMYISMVRAGCNTISFSHKKANGLKKQQHMKAERVRST